LIVSSHAALTIFKNTGARFFARVSDILFAFALNIYAARYIGVLLSLCTTGLNIVITCEIAK